MDGMSVIFPSSIKTISIFNASFGTRELPQALLSAIRSVYSKPWNVNIVSKLEYNREDILYIIICPAGLGKKDVTMPKYYINWQLEFLIGTYNVPVYIKRMKDAIVNWDYSQYNINISRDRDNINSVYFPPGFNECIAAPDILNGDYIYTDEGKDIDILFLGYCDAYPRRVQIRNNCYRTGLKCWFVSDLDLEGMKKAIRRSKVCINIAQCDVFALAKVRLNILLSNQACIVSEFSIDKEDDIFYGCNGVCFVPFENVIETAWNLVNNFEVRRNMAIKSYQWYRKECHWNRIVDFNKLLPKT